MKTTAQVNVLLVGDVARSEFREAVGELRRLALVEMAATPDAARRSMAAGEFVPDLIVVAQAFPGQFSVEEIDGLRSQSPLARVVGLLGSWCEGETRSGKPWPAAIRVYWHQWPIRCRRELRRFRAGRGSSWTLPVTASDEEQFLAIADEPSACRPQLSGAESAESRVASQTDEPSACRPELSAGQGVLPVSRKGLVVIHSRQFEMQQWLAAACRRRGYATVWSRSGRSTCVEGARAAIFDFTGGIDAEREDLRSLVERLRPAPVVALLNFPRVEDRDCLVAWGAAAVLSKPVLLADLFEQLNDLLNEPWDLS